MYDLAVRFAFNFKGLLSEVEVKYKMSQCYLRLKEHKEATTIVCTVKLYSFGVKNQWWDLWIVSLHKMMYQDCSGLFALKFNQLFWKQFDFVLS